MISSENELYIVDGRALPESVIKTVEAKRLLESGRSKHVQEACEVAGVSRSAYYKYRDLVFPFYDKSRGQTVTFALNIYDRPGALSNVLNAINKFGANILTVNATIPINRVSNTTITIEINGGDLHELSKSLAMLDGVSSFKVIARE
jgi:chorismate mutase